MKIKLLILVSAIGLPIYVSAQKTYLYNEGLMSVKGTNATNTVLYIGGDFKSGNNTTTNTHCNIELTTSKTVLTGDFFHNDMAQDANVFTLKDATSVFEFAGTDVQNITVGKQVFADIPSKKTSFINFPTLVINNDLSATGANQADGAVFIDPALAVKASNITLSKGWLVLKSEILDSSNKGKYLPVGSTADASKRTVIAHMMLNPTIANNKINYNWGTAATDVWNRGVIEVDLALRTPTEAAETGTTRPLTAFGSPFKGMKSDYFMWNFLLAPSPDNVFGPEGTSVVNPLTTLTPGRGYFIGIDLRGNSYSSYKWDISENIDDGKVTLNELMFNARAKEGYKFNRSKFASQSNSNNVFGNTTSGQAAYTDEQLNGETDVKVQLQPGYNYLANPYTAPLNITALLTAAGNVPDWGIISGPSTTTTRQIFNRAWILNNNSSTGQGNTTINNKDLKIQLNYYLAKTSGSTYTDQYNDGDNDPTVGGSMTTIPPLQMFLVYAVQPAEITIPRSAQVMGNTTFMRSANTSEQPHDDFLFEVVDDNSGSSDRASIVLRTKSEILENVEYTNVSKIKAFSSFEEKGGVIPTKNEDGLDKGFSSIIYTKSEDNNILTANYLSYSNYQSNVSTTLYIQPSLTEQEITVRGLRLGTMQEFEEVILKDKLTGKEKVLTATDNEYKTSTKPTDRADRFDVIFKRNTTGIDDEIINNGNNTKSISSYYASGVLTVTGFDESDFGSVLSVYDIQGRLVKQVSVNDFTVNVSHPFISGAYIVKVVGNGSYVAKFLVR